MKTFRTLANGDVRSIGAQAPNAGKPRRDWLRALSALALVGLWLALSACSREPPEQRLRASIAAMQAAAESRSGDGVLEHVADDFIGPRGMDRDGLRRYVAVAMLGNQRVGVTLGPLEVEMQGERARVRFTAAATGGQSWLPERGRVYQVDTGWRMAGGEWRLVSAEWE
ncbi:MAG TPA: nuclear transport factor 2 family protein [Arenimonas sp.]|nr:nuclear transport factor 2 family protein [Arenimonas sp.]